MSIGLKSNTTLFYYSATGNSLWVAKQLQSQIPDCTFSPIIRHLKQDRQDISFQTIGLVFPIHKFGIPQIIRDFLKSASFPKNSYVFAVITGGNPKLGAGLFQVQSLLKEQSLKLNAGFHFRMPATYFPLIPKKNQSTNLSCSTESTEKLQRISTIIQNKENHIEHGVGLLNRINRIKLRKNQKLTLKFHVDEGCIRCGYCVMVCPYQNILIVNKKPEFSDHCNTCFACVHYCSQGVLQYGSRTQGKQRIHHPAITIGDLMTQKR